MNKPTIGRMAMAAMLSASALLTGCNKPTPPKAPEAVASGVVESTRRRLCEIEGGPLTQCCEVSGSDSKAVKMAEDGTHVDLRNEDSAKGFFSCALGSRFVAGKPHEKPVWACLEDSFENVDAKGEDCPTGTHPEPIVYCAAEKDVRNVRWRCYSDKGPFEM